MIIRDFTFHPFKMKLKKPLINSAFSIDKREGFIVKITDENDFIGFGEVSPLPGFSLETKEKCEVELNRLHYSIIEKASKGLEFDLMQELQSVANLPSLRFGIEQAIISLLIKRNELSTLLSSSKVINVNGVVGLSTKEETLKEIDNLLASDYKTIKIKLGKTTFNEDIDLVNTITGRIDNSIKIRLDINGNWNYTQAETAVKAMDNSKIELIEQPVNNINELVMLSDFSPIPIAVDEIIKNSVDAKNLIEKSNIKTFVLKPSILGGVIEVIGLITAAEKQDKKIIISSAFESVVGRSAVALLASLVKGEHAHGLSTASFIETDLANDIYTVNNGGLYFNHQTYPPSFDGIVL